VVNICSSSATLLITSCNCPLDQNEKQIQFVNNWTKVSGNHTTKFGVDIRRAYNIRAPSDRGRAGELLFYGARTQGPTAPGTVGGGSGLATFLLGDVSQLQRYVGGTVADEPARTAKPVVLLRSGLLESDP